MPRGDGPHPEPGRRREVLAVAGSNATHPASAGSAASKTKAAAARVAARAIAASLVGAPPRGNGGPGRAGADACPVPTGLP